MSDLSRPVVSRQLEPHPRLAEAVTKHRLSSWKKPVASHSAVSFARLLPDLKAWPGPLILDSGCGTGMSTWGLAQRYPEALVVGIDKSLARLSRNSGPVPANVRLVRMELGDFWVLAHAEGLSFRRQCFYYPNPWPKPEHRLRRWPFHPVFPLIVAGGGTLELRTNWKIYAQEFALAVGILSGATPEVLEWHPQNPETLFEKKFLASGHALWRCEAAIEPKG